MFFVLIFQAKKLCQCYFSRFFQLCDSSINSSIDSSVDSSVDSAVDSSTGQWTAMGDS